MFFRERTFRTICKLKLIYSHVNEPITGIVKFRFYLDVGVQFSFLNLLKRQDKLYDFRTVQNFVLILLKE